MATIEKIILTDSLDERIQNGVETVTFYDPNTGEKREIELGEANRKHFANHLEKLVKYIDASRIVETAKPAKAAPKANGEQAKIREWAKANGYPIGDRGRIKAEIVEAYNKTNVDLTQYTTDDESGKLLDEATASVELDGETQTVDSEPETAVQSTQTGSVEAEQGTDEAWKGDGPSDAEILALMSQLESANGEVTLADLKSAVDSKTE